jgi:hypothetical protein
MMRPVLSDYDVVPNAQEVDVYTDFMHPLSYSRYLLNHFAQALLPDYN